MNITIPGVTTSTSAVSLEKIEDVYNTILDVQRELNVLYQESSSTLKNGFESIQLFAPELKNHLRLAPLPTTPAPLPTTPAPKSPQRPESLSEKQKPLSHPKKPLETSSQSPKSSTSSSNKWMLKHQGPGSGLIELIPDSEVYVSEVELKQCNLVKTDMKKFGRLLLAVVFSKEAFQKCTFSTRSKKNRCLFDEHATNTFVGYVTKHARELGWEVVSRSNLLQTCNNKILVLSKHQFKYSPVKIDF